MHLFQLGDFVLHSGARSYWKLECDALSDGDIACLAEMIRQLVGPYSSVEGIPRGGLRLAAALEPHAIPVDNHRLYVDDVLTTGRSLQRAALNVHIDHQKLAKGAVVFARGPCPWWVKALFQMPECFWVTPPAR